MKLETIDGKRYDSCRFSEHEKSYGQQCYDGQCPEESVYPLFLVDHFLYDLDDRLLDHLRLWWHNSL